MRVSSNAELDGRAIESVTSIGADVLPVTVEGRYQRYCFRNSCRVTLDPAEGERLVRDTTVVTQELWIGEVGGETPIRIDRSAICTGPFKHRHVCTRLVAANNDEIGPRLGRVDPRCMWAGPRRLTAISADCDATTPDS